MILVANIRVWGNPAPHVFTVTILTLSRKNQNVCWASGEFAVKADIREKIMRRFPGAKRYFFTVTTVGRKKDLFDGDISSEEVAL